MNKLKTISEKELQKKVIAWLQKLQDKGELLFKKDQAGLVYMKGTNGMFPITLKKGFADIVIYTTTGKYHSDLQHLPKEFSEILDERPLTIFLELKTDIGKLRPSQIENRDKLLGLGFEYFVLRPRDWENVKNSDFDLLHNFRLNLVRE